MLHKNMVVRVPKVMKRVKSWLGSRLRNQQLLYAHHRYLKSGRYIVRGSLIHRFNYIPPSHLLQWSGDSAVSAIILLINPFRPLGNYTCLARVNGGVLLLGGASGTVTRVSVEPIFDHTYAILRNHFSRHVPSPSFEIDRKGRAQLERQVNGVFLYSCDDSQQLRVLRDLIKMVARLCKDCKQKKSNFYLYKPISLLIAVKLPSPFASWLPLLRSSYLISNVLQVPSHGDLLPKNILITNSKFSVIDWDPRYVSRRPFWYDIMSFINSSDYLRRTYLSGELDMDFNQLLKAAALPLEIKSVRRLLPAALSVTRCSPDVPLGSERHYKKMVEHFQGWAYSSDQEEFLPIRAGAVSEDI